MYMYMYMYIYIYIYIYMCVYLSIIYIYIYMSDSQTYKIYMGLAKNVSIKRSLTAPAAPGFVTSFHQAELLRAPHVARLAAPGSAAGAGRGRPRRPGTACSRAAPQWSRLASANLIADKNMTTGRQLARQLASSETI